MTDRQSFITALWSPVWSLVPFWSFPGGYPAARELCCAYYTAKRLDLEDDGQLNATDVSERGICTTYSSKVDVLGRARRCWPSTSVQPLLNALRLTHAYFPDTARVSYISDWIWFPPTWQERTALRTSTCNHIYNRLTMFNPDVQRYDTLTAPHRRWRMTQTMYLCPLHGEICGQIILFHVRPTLSNIPWDSFVRFKCGAGISVL
jgi:hypothetical protein